MSQWRNKSNDEVYSDADIDAMAAYFGGMK